MIIQRIKSFISSGSERSQIVKKNAIGSLTIKLLSMIVDFAKVPILLSYLDSERYGLYVTIASIVYWTHNFDFGLGAGLRYKLTTAIAVGDFHYGRRLVSTAYYSMSTIMGCLLLILLPIIACLDWGSMLNTNIVANQELILCVSLVLIVFVVQFVLELITYVLQAYQKAALSSLFKPLANLATIIVVFLLKFFSHGNLLYACLAMTLPIVIVLANNGVLGMVRQWQNLFFGKRFSNTVLERKTDFVKLAEAFGAVGMRATNIGEFEDAFKKAVNMGCPVVIDTFVDKDEFVLPMLPPGGSIDDIIVEKGEK